MEDTEQTTATVRVYGKSYPFLMPAELTMGELADAEKITGQGYDLNEGGYAGFLALTYLSVRRVDDRITVDEIRSLAGDEIQFVRPEAVPLPPTKQDGSSETGDSSVSDSSPPSGLHPVKTRLATGDPN